MTLRLRYQTIEFGDMDIHVRSLRDTLEFQDDDGEAEALGISSAFWSLFGVVWDSGRALARLMADYELGERRILEVGCGLGLASLVLNQRDSDITATDLHPEADAFLQANALLNDGPAIPFVRTDWADRDDELGSFDLIIGSDLLYEHDQIFPLADFIGRHARPSCEVILLDPRRGAAGRFGKRMEGEGFSFTRRPADAGDQEPAYSGEVLRFLRRGA